MSRGLAVLLLACACGRFGFDRGEARDATAFADSSLDGANVFDARPCGGTAHTVTENFDDNMRNPTLWGNAYTGNLTTYAETGGRLAISLGVSSADDWAGYVTTAGYELANDRVFIEVPQISTGPGTNTVLLLFASLALQEGPSIESDAGSVQFRKRVGGAIIDLGQVTYDPVEHRWWQIRESNGRTYWELSRDGSSWVTGYDEPSPARTTAFITLVAGTNNATASPGTAMFDNLNGGGAPRDCP